ncbi:MAG: hypothetical protein HFE46_08590 [Clostridia bacterium]|nr:hypothetical protein [Clostridia bacterium]
MKNGTFLCTVASSALIFTDSIRLFFNSNNALVAAFPPARRSTLPRRAFLIDRAADA